MRSLKFRIFHTFAILWLSSSSVLADDIDIREIVSSELEDISLEGYLEREIDVVDVVVDESMSLSFTPQYSSDPSAYSRWFGEGWKIALMESVEYEIDRGLTSVSFPWGASTKVLLDETGVYRSVDERWTGKRAGKTLQLFNKYGLTLTYKGGRLTNLRTIGGKSVSWDYRHPVIRIIEGRNNVLFEFKHGRNGATLKVESSTRLFDFRLDQEGRLEEIYDSGKLSCSFKYKRNLGFSGLSSRDRSILGADFKTSRFGYFAYHNQSELVASLFDFETRRPLVVSVDEDYAFYEIVYKEGENIEAELDILKRSPEGSDLSYSYDRAKGTYCYTFDEITLRDTYIMTPGPLFMKLRRSEKKVGDEAYEPVKSISYYPNGKIKRAVNYPDQVLTYSYNADDQLTEVTDGDELLASWSYDSNGICYREIFMLPNRTQIELRLRDGESPNLIAVDTSGKSYESTVSSEALNMARATYNSKISQN